IRADVDLQDEAERDDPERLRESDQGFPKYFPQDDRVARDRRDEDLLAEILLPIREERDESERRRLPDGLREHAREDVVEEVQATGAVAEARLEARAENADEDQRNAKAADVGWRAGREL